MCGPAKVDAHGHGHGHGEEQDAAHAAEGFGTKVCEDGIVRAVWESMWPSSSEWRRLRRQTQIKVRRPTQITQMNPQVQRRAWPRPGKEEGESSEGLVKLSSGQIKAASIEMQPAASGKLSKEVAAPGRITMNANAQARIVSKLTGTVASIDKQLGDTVSAGDLLATIDSREMADAKADFLAASRTEELARSTYEREERLWKQKVTAEQEFLAARNAHAEAKIRLDVSHQRLHAIGISDDEIKRLPKIGDESSFRIYELRAPISGQVAARDLVLGQTVRHRQRGVYDRRSGKGLGRACRSAQ